MLFQGKYLLEQMVILHLDSPNIMRGINSIKKMPLEDSKVIPVPKERSCHHDTHVKYVSYIINYSNIMTKVNFFFFKSRSKNKVKVTG